MSMISTFSTKIDEKRSSPFLMSAHVRRTSNFHLYFF